MPSPSPRSLLSSAAAALLLLLAGPASPVTPAAAHICLFHPAQRGLLVLDNPGEPACFRPKGPCGQPAASSHPPTQMLGVAGSSYTVHFQQALNHFNVTAPGVLRVQIALTGGAAPTESDFAQGAQFGQMIPDFNAMDMMKLTNLTVTGTLPQQSCQQCVMRVTYQSNNDMEPDMFYVSDHMHYALA